MNKKLIFAIVFFFAVSIFAADRVSRYDEFQGGDFSGDTATITTINTTTITGTTLTGTTVNGGNLSLSGNSLKSTDTNGNILIDPDGSGLSIFNDLTATTVPYLGASKEMLSSSVTPTELGYVSGVTSAIQTQIDGKTNTFSGSTDNVVMRSDGTGGATIQESGITVSDADAMSGLTQIDLITEGALRFQDASGGEYMGFKSPATVTSSVTFTLPDGDGSAGNALKTDGAGTLSWGAAGGGGGSKNYFTDGTFEAGIGLASTYDDAGAFVDGTGGSPTVVTISQNSTTPLEASNDLAIAKSASDGSGEGVCLTSDAVDKYAGGRSLWFTAELDFTDANYNAGDMELKAYDAGTGAEILTVFPVAGLADDGTIQKASQRAVAYIQTTGDTDSAVRVCLHLTDTATAAAWTAYVDEATLAPQATVPGAIMGEWTTFTPTGSWSTNTTYTGVYKRVGDTAHFDVLIATSGAPTATPLNVVISSVGTIDTSKLGSTGVDQVLGHVVVNDSLTTFYDSIAIYQSGSEVAANIQASGAATTFSSITATNPITFGSGDYVHMKFSVPINGWSSSASLNTTEANLFSARAFANNVTPTGTIAAAYNTLIFGTVDEDKFGLYNTSTGIWTAPRDGTVDVSAFGDYSGTPATGKTAFIRIENVTTGKYVIGEQSNGGAINVKRPTASGQLKVSKDDTLEIQSWCDMASCIIGGSNFSIAYDDDLTVFSTYLETVPTAIISEPVDFTPSFSGFTLGNGTVDRANYWREGSFMMGRLQVTLGTTSVMGDLAFDIPAGETIDTSLLVVGNDNSVGIGYAVDTGSNFYPSMIVPTTTTALKMIARTSSGSYVGIATMSTTIPFTWAATDRVDLSFKIPISGWDASSVISTTQANREGLKAVYLLTSGTGNSSFADAASEIVDFDTLSIDTHSAVTTGASWKFTAPFDGEFTANATMLWANTTNMNYTALELYKNGAFFRRLDLRNGTAGQQLSSASQLFTLRKNDYIDIRALQDDTAAGARSVDTTSGYTVINIKGEPDLSYFSIYDQTKKIVEKTSAFTFTENLKQVIGDTTSAAFTVTLPSAGDMPQRNITISKKTALTDFNKLTVSDGGSFSLFLIGAGESVDLYSDGTSWGVKGWHKSEDMAWTITTSITNSSASGSVSFQRETMTVEDGLILVSGAGSAAASSITLPGSLAFDTARLVNGTDVTNAGASRLSGHQDWFDNGTGWKHWTPEYKTSTTFGGSINTQKLFDSVVASGDSLSLSRLRIPIN